MVHIRFVTIRFDVGLHWFLLKSSKELQKILVSWKHIVDVQYVVEWISKSCPIEIVIVDL